MESYTSKRSIVVLANSHNPSLVSDYFLLKAEMIKDIDELDRNNSVYTPSYSRVVLKDGTSIQVENTRLGIVGEDIKAFDLASKYCKALPFIKATGIGINFDIEISDYKFDDLLSNESATKFRDSRINMIDLTFSVNSLTTCYVKLVRGETSSSGLVVLNFHTEFNDKSFSEIDFDILKSYEDFTTVANEFINQLFK
ncbi:hypothetical protein [Chitinophaga filiformis]|uniref:Uncharacterized protein n=1 Tax=Chitinophaga filiformis TaxID=104663 RepID=A0ABY4HY03_CHIFI|nr:hypothetical protein [Chitinophaga filiformis]UPK68308.1 hypothetical protein MYF79_25455 [Chitinophaga filiformis]